MLVLALAPAADAGAQNRVKRITIDLAGATLDSVLPFDERFVLAGAASDLLTAVDAVYRRDAVPRDSLQRCDVRSGDSTASWRRLQSLTDSQFELLIGPLDANASYGFCFTVKSKPSAERTLAFQRIVADRIDREFRRSGNDRVTSADVTTLCAELPRLVAPLQTDVRSGSLLDCPGQAERLSALLRLAHLNTVMGNRRNALNATQASIEAIRTGLGGLARDGAGFRVLAQGTTKLTQAGPLVALSQRFLALDEGARGYLADGTVRIGDVPGSGPAGLGEAWTAPDLAIRIANFAALEAALDSMTRLIILAEQLGDPNVLQPGGAAIQMLAEHLNGLTQKVRATQHSLARMAGLLDQRQLVIDSAARALAFEAREYIEVWTTTIATFLTRGGWQITPNLSVAYFPMLREISPVAGVNFNLTAVNRDVPLRSRDSFWRRASLVLGITTGTLARSGRREDLFGSKCLVTGAGLRVTDFAQVGFGLLWLKAPDPDPAIDRSRIRATGYLSAGVDATLKSLLGGLANIFP